MHSQINFGYPWVINYGHLVLAAAFLAIFALGWFFKWRKPVLAVFGLLTLWAFTAFVMVRFGFDMNGRAALPTQVFAPSGAAKVLDMGAGTGRSTLMVLEARPQTTVVALDSFSDSYAQHFGGQGTAPLAGQGSERLLANMRAAGADRRVSVVTGDMRHMPLPSDSFDDAVSAYAIDHLDPPGIHDALAEAFRVIKPGGQFLLIVMHPDNWVSFCFGPMMEHSPMAPAVSWDRSVRAAGFAILEQGTKPATRYVLARKP